MLANLVLGENAFPEFIQEDCTPQKLSAALLPLFQHIVFKRGAQLSALVKIREKLFLPDGSPGEKAAAYSPWHFKVSPFHSNAQQPDWEKE